MGMRHSLLVGGVVSLGALMAVACSSSSNGGVPDDDAGSSGTSGTSGGTSGTSGGTSGTSGTSGSSGDPDGGDGGDGGPSTVTTLKKGASVLVGVTSDGYAAYIAITGTTASLEVIPVAGGTATVLLPSFAQTDGVRVSGSTVAYWTGVTTGVGTLGYWTKATGVKAAVSTTSAKNFFFSNPDSSRIAFSVGATATATGTSLAVTTPALASPTPVLTGANYAINLASAVPPAVDKPATCVPDIGFTGKALFAAYCTGVAATATDARLVTVPDGATPAVKRLDAVTAGAAESVQPLWSASTAGDKVFTINSAPNARGRIIFNAATVTSATLDVDTQDGVMLDDGSSVVFRVENAAGTTKAIRRATAVAAPVTTDLVATAAEGLLSISRDQKHALYHTLPFSADGLVDIRVLSTTPPPALTDIVPTAAAYPFGFTGDNTTVLYQTDPDANGIGKLKSKPVAGGAEKTLATNMYDLRPLTTGAGVLILDNPKQVTGQKILTVDIKYLDVAAGGTPKLLADTVPTTSFIVSGTRLVYSLLGTGAGVYSTTIP